MKEISIRWKLVKLIFLEDEWGWLSRELADIFNTFLIEVFRKQNFMQ